MSDIPDDDIYGFRGPDKEHLIDLIEGSGSQDTQGTTSPPRRDFWMKTKSGGIPANDKANCFYREPTDTGWQDTTTEYEVWNQHPTAPVGGTKIILVGWVNGRLCCKTEFC
jgi:hypothetical protein